MKKNLYYLLKIILISVVIFNMFFLFNNIFEVSRDIYYIEVIQKDFSEMMNKRLNDSIIKNIEYITKVEVGDNFPTGVYNIKISYIDKEGLKESTIINENTRHNEETIIVNYIKEKGFKDISLKIKYFVIICFTCVFIILLIYLNKRRITEKDQNI